MQKGELSVGQIARQQNVTPQWARVLLQRFKKEGFLPVPGKPGPTPKPILWQEIALVSFFKRENGCGAVRLEEIMKKNGVKLSHNRIHQALKIAGLANNEPAKQQRRKWVRWEREHSNSLWHTDYYEFQGMHVIAYLDDASRLVTGVGVFDAATAENAVLVLNQAIVDFGKPIQVLSDHGTQFTADIFQQCLAQHGIEHIKARVKHPQTNGKIERWFSTLNQLVKHFSDFDYAVWFYNNKRPHMSLDQPDRLVTPIEAFNEKKVKK